MFCGPEKSSNGSLTRPAWLPPVITPLKISKVIEDPNIKIETSKNLNSNVLKQRVNVDILKQRLLEQKKKDRVKRTIILSTVVVSLGALTMLTY